MIKVKLIDLNKVPPETRKTMSEDANGVDGFVHQLISWPKSEETNDKARIWSHDLERLAITFNLALTQFLASAESEREKRKIEQLKVLLQDFEAIKKDLIDTILTEDLFRELSEDEIE